MSLVSLEYPHLLENSAPLFTLVKCERKIFLKETWNAYMGHISVSLSAVEG